MSAVKAPVQIPDTITKHPSILASLLASADASEVVTAGAEAWHPLLRAALPLMALTDADHIRVVLADHTVIIQRELDIVGVAIVTGDPIVKSIHRMIRRVIVPAKRGAKPKTAAPASAPPARQTEAEATAQRHDAEVRLGAIRERRIVENEGRDSDGDLVFRDGKPHPAHAPGPR